MAGDTPLAAAFHGTRTGASGHEPVNHVTMLHVDDEAVGVLTLVSGVTGRMVPELDRDRDVFGNGV